jgi:hypothetical protein
VVEDQIYNEYELINAITDPVEGTLEILIDEGPDLSVVKLFGKSFLESLHMLADNLLIDKKNIKIITYNLIQDCSVWPDIEIRHPTEYFTAADRFEVPVNKDIQKHFGLFVGTSRWHRLYIASTMYGLHKDKTMMSFWQHHLNKDLPANLRMDDVMLKDANETLRKHMFDFAKHLPLHLDEEDKKINDNKGADITRGDWETPYEILTYYNRIFLDIVCETWHEGECFLPNEKTGRPIIAKTPFIAYAGRGFLGNLKKIGFKTFDKWWSEEYDNYEGVQRIQRMLLQIKNISSQPIENLYRMYNDMQPVLEHNYKLIKTLTPSKMLEIL